MKKAIINWERRSKLEMRHSLSEVEEQIHDLFLLTLIGVLSIEELATLAGLKIRKEKILELEATSWRIKSWVV